VLLIEDTPDDALLVERALVKAGYELTILRVENALAMSDALDRESWDVVISDYNLPSFDAPAALSLLQAHDLDIPFILVSGTVSEHAAVTSMKAGAHDYLLKSNLKRLGPAVARELQEARNRSERRKAEQALRESEARYRENAVEIERSLAQVVAHLDFALEAVHTRLLADGQSVGKLEHALRDAHETVARVRRMVTSR